MQNIDQNWTFPYLPEPPLWRIDWQQLELYFGWLSAMRNCPQDPIYHQEGDLLTHTKMVCEELVSMNSWRAMAQTERSILFAAALLHDVAKPDLTKIGTDQRISSKGHAKNGAKRAREILWKLGTPFSCREMIVSLVRHSSLPFFALEKPNPSYSVIKASQTVRSDWLAMLEEADAKGRICADRQILIEKVELFRELCEENRCYNQPRSFSSPHSRFLYFYKEGSSLDYQAFDDTEFEVVLMSGLPGAGKDSWIRENVSMLAVISLDLLREELQVAAHKNQGQVVYAAKEKAREYMRRKQSFVWNATNITKQLRSQLISLFHSYRAKIRIVYLETELEEIYRRNRMRERSVPSSVIAKLVAKLDLPDLTESHTVDYYINP
ncbi:MAG: AAA family ATPase [Blastocatellia bacterium]|nr:AAA family ATPase [Blastocatellia bacterium]